MSTIEKEEEELNKIKISNNKYEYRQRDKIGAGSFGSVYKVKDKYTNKM
jgi:serine/threonine protein kinase